MRSSVFLAVVATLAMANVAGANTIVPPTNAPSGGIDPAAWQQVATELKLSPVQSAALLPALEEAPAITLSASQWPLPGDANLDGAVNFKDLIILARNYDSTHGTWGIGDFDSDGHVDFHDLIQLARNYGKSVSLPIEPTTGGGADPAPLPSSLLGGGMLLVVLGLARRHRRKVS